MKDNTRQQPDGAGARPVSLGHIYITPGAQQAFADAGIAPIRYLIRHGLGHSGKGTSVVDHHGYSNQQLLHA